MLSNSFESNNQRSSVLMKLLFYLTLIYILMISTPVLMRNYLHIIIFIGCLWFFLAFVVVNYRNGKTKVNKLVFAIIVWQVWVFLLKFIGYSTMALGNYAVNFLFYLSFIMAIIIGENFNISQKKYIWTFSCIVITANFIDNIRLSILYPNSSLLINTEYGSNFINMNVGNSSLSFVAMIFIGICMIVFWNAKAIIDRMLYCSAILVSICVITYQARATSLIFTIALIILLLQKHLNSRFSNNGKILYNYLSFFSLIVVVLFSVSILNYVISIISQDRLIMKFTNIVDFLSGSTQIGLSGDDSLVTRLYLAKISLSTFISTPISLLIGVGLHDSHGGYTGPSIGLHSQLIDNAAEYGIVGIVAVFYILITFRNYVILKIENKLVRKQINVIYGTVIVFSFFNNSFYPEISVVFVIMLSLIPYVTNRNLAKMEGLYV